MRAHWLAGVAVAALAGCQTLPFDGTCSSWGPKPGAAVAARDAESGVELVSHRTVDSKPAQLEVAVLMSRLAAREPSTILDADSSFGGSFQRVQVRGAKPFRAADLKAGVWPKDRLTVVYSANDDASAKAVQQLREQGYTEAYALQGGLTAWQSVGGPVEMKR
jgi:rhodanese-related sulfurtransferase